MKPLSLNLKDAKKVSGDNTHSIFHLPSGHQIKIAHQALPAIQRKAIEKMPIHAAEGVDLNSAIDQDVNDGQAAAIDDSPKPEPTMADKINNNEYDPLGLMPEKAAANPETSQPEPTKPEQIQPEASPVASAPTEQKAEATDLISKAYNQGQLGIQQARDVEQKSAESNAKIEKDNIKAMQDLNTASQQNFKDFQAQQISFINDLKNNHINPDHYRESMSAGKKVRTAIGLALGGFSSGFSGGNNPAMDFLNKQIDRDIESQKANIDNKRTLYAANRALYGDQVMAENATRAQMNDINIHEMRLAADQLGTPLAIAKYNQNAAAYTMQNAQLLQQNAMRATALHAEASGGAGLKDPSVLVPALVPKEHQQKVFDEIQSAQDTARNTPAILQAFDNAAKNIHGADFIPGVENVDQKAMHVLLGPTFKDVEGTVRQAAMDNLNHNATPQFGDNANTIKTKREALVGYLTSKSSAPTAKGYGIDLNKYPTTSVQGATGQGQYHVGQVGYVNGHKVKILNSNGDFAPVK